MSWKAIRARWKERESKLGNFIKIAFGYVLAICSAAGAVLEYTKIIPDDWIPMELKYTIAVLSFIGFVAGKMTKRKEEDGPSKNNNTGI